MLEINNGKVWQDGELREVDIRIQDGKIKEDIMGTGKIGKLEISVLGADSGDGSKRFEMKF